MALGVGNIIGKKIADALGLKNCKSIDIHVEGGKIVTVKAEFYPEIDGIKQFIPVLEEYELIRKEKAADTEEEWKSL